MESLTPLAGGFDPAYLCMVDEIYHDSWSAEKLLRIRWLKRSIEQFWPAGHPSRLIHVAGTNGKGSTCRLIEAALGLVGTSGAMTNPHLFDFAERCSIAGAPLSHQTWSRLWRDVVQPHSLDRGDQDPSRCLTFAEAGILLALHAFDQHQVRWGLIETGVGGRYAPSMAISPGICVLTNVGRDHPGTLGEALWQRALEKAGIARPGVPLVTGARGQALDVIRLAADQVEAPLTVVGDREIEGVLDLAGGVPGLSLRLTEHGRRNLALAWTVARLAEPALEPAPALQAMLSMPPLPGRFWQARPHLLADVAHNPDKLAALAEQLDQDFPGGRPLLLVFGVSRERSLQPMLEPLAGRVRRVVFTGASYAGRSPELLCAECRAAFPHLEPSWIAEPGEALAWAERERRPEELIVLTGSAYTIDQAMNPNPFLKRMNAEYGRRGHDATAARGAAPGPPPDVRPS